MPRAKKVSTDDAPVMLAPVPATETAPAQTETASNKKYSDDKMGLINLFAAALLGSADLHRVLEQPDVFESRLSRVFDTAIKAAEHSITLAQEKVQ